jgi:hypothetical protein
MQPRRVRFVGPRADAPLRLVRRHPAAAARRRALRVAPGDAAAGHALRARGLQVRLPPSPCVSLRVSSTVSLSVPPHGTPLTR